MAVDGAPGVMGALSFDPAESSEVSRWRTLVAGVDIARAAAPDTIVFWRGAELEAIAFDPIRMAVAGTPRAVVAPVATAHGRRTTRSRRADRSPGPSRPRPSSAELPGLAWWSPSGFQAATDEIRRLRDAALSPDGSRIAGVNIEGAPGGRLGDRRAPWHGDPPDAQRHQLIADLVRRRPDRLLRVAGRRRVRDMGTRRGRHPGCDATVRPRRGSRARASLAVSPDGSDARFPADRRPRRAPTSWSLPLAGGPARPLVNGPFDDMRRQRSRPTRSSSPFSPPTRDAGRSTCSASATDAGSWSRPTAASGPHWARDGLYFQSRGHLARAAIADAETFRVEVGHASRQSAGRDAAGRRA